MANVLVIDDENDLRLLVRVMLERAGHHITEMGSGEEGLAELDENTFDLVILDVRLPDMDGIEVLRSIKAKHADSCVIVLTAHSSGHARDAALQAGADGYLSKPFDKNELIQVVDSCLG